MSEIHKNYTVSIKKLPNSEIEISGAIPASEFDATRIRAIKALGTNAQIDGFRKGHVPEKVLAEKIGEAAILEEMAEIALTHAYAHILTQEKIDAIGRPQISLTKIAIGNPLEFKAVTAVFPEFTLPDYKKIAKQETAKKETIEVSEADVEKTIDEIRRMRAKEENKQESEADVSPNNLPPLTDEFVKTLGNFDNVADFRVKLRENMLVEKTRAQKDKKRVAIVEAILKETPMDLPNIIVEQELNRMQDELSSDIERMGLTLDAYLEHTKKTQEDLLKEWRPDAQKRAGIQLITGKIAEAEKIEPSEEEILLESEKLTRHYPDASTDRVRSYVQMLLTNEKVFQFLETT